MRIVSTLANVVDSNGKVRTVFNTFADGRHVVTAIALSPDGGNHVSEMGQQTLDLASAHHQAHYPQAAVHIVPVLAAAAARARIVDVMRACSEHDLVLILSRTDEIQAGVMKILGLTRPGGGYGRVQ